MKEIMRLHGTARINQFNHLEIGGCDTVELVKKYGTPLYLIDEYLIRKNCRDYINCFSSNYDRVKVVYAGKAFLDLAMCRIVEEEGLCLDVVSGGELYTALRAGFPPDRIIFHGNNKTDSELKMAAEHGVGRIVVDNMSELMKTGAFAKQSGKVINIYIRVSPGVEAHTHDYIKTGQIDSKFGFPLLNDQALNAVKIAKSMENISLMGLHCHIGSQIFEIQPYIEAVNVMMKFASIIKKEFEADIPEIDFGGGFGIYYSDGDSPLPKKVIAESITDCVKKNADIYNLKRPCILVEPGRSIIGNAGTTLYNVGAIKNIPGIRKYVIVDGGMTDNIRPALYRAKYEAAVANRMNSSDCEVVTIAGKCCESGDILVKDINMPKVNTGDIISIFSTGAYGLSMSSNYNGIPKPCVVLVNDGGSYVISKRETYDEIIENDIIPDELKRI